jgi:hypothetical protein
MARVDWAQLATKPLARTGRVRCASWKHRTLSLLRTRSIIAMPVRRARETCCFAADGDPCTVPEAVRRIFATHVRGRDRSALPLHSHVQASWSRWALPHHRHAAGASSTLSAQTCRSLLCPALRLHLGLSRSPQRHLRWRRPKGMRCLLALWYARDHVPRMRGAPWRPYTKMLHAG